MSYHNDPYRVDYLKIYPCLKERPDVLEVLKKSDRKMKYMEVDLKSEQRRKNAENGAESYVPSKEDSLERLIYSAKCQFADDAEGVEDAVIRKDNLFRLRAALDQLSEEERALIHALFFDERSERELEEMMGVHRMTIHNRKIRTIVCMGHEPDLKGAMEQELTDYKVDIQIMDILRDRADLQLKRDSEAEIVREGGKLVIRAFYPMNLMQKLSLQKEYVEDWRQLVDSVMIDWNYDGVVMQPAVTDVPGKSELVKGIYDIPEGSGTIKVKITDLLSESLEVEVR